MPLEERTDYGLLFGKQNYFQRQLLITFLDSHRLVKSEALLSHQESNSEDECTTG